MTRRLGRIEPVSKAPDTARGIAAFFSAVGAVGALPAIVLLLVAFTVIVEKPASGAIDGGWYAALGSAVWIVLGFAQWGFHLLRSLRRRRVPGSSPQWWLGTFLYNAAYAIGCAVMTYQDPHVGSVVVTGWFLVLSVLAVSAYRDDLLRTQRG
jgi:hypothetical protein